MTGKGGSTERYGSPNLFGVAAYANGGGAKQQQQPRGVYVRSNRNYMEYVSGGGGVATHYNGRIRRKTDPTAASNAVQIPRQSTPTNSSSSGSASPSRGSPSLQGGFYAGAKFSEPPSPASLPEPPSHWMMMGAAGGCRGEYYHQDGGDRFHEISNQLKMLLNIRA